jgi:hypothetical protein
MAIVILAEEVEPEEKEPGERHLECMRLMTKKEKLSIQISQSIIYLCHRYYKTQN